MGDPAIIAVYCPIPGCRKVNMILQPEDEGEESEFFCFGCKNSVVIVRKEDDLEADQQ